MRPVDQTLFGHGVGNCFAACVASVLEVPLADVPNFCVEYSESEWYFALARWLGERGFAPLTQQVNPAVFFEWCSQLWPEVYWIAGGPNPRGVSHAVVYRGAKLVHDPNPIYRDGLLEVTDATYILVADPARAEVGRV